MPLVYDVNWLGRKRLFLPPFTQALGIFSVHVLSQKRTGYFLREATARFDKIEYALTGETTRNTQAVNWNWTDTRNFVLDIDSRHYDEVAQDYDAELLRRLQRSNDANLLVHGNQKPERLAEFMVKYYPGGERLQHPLLRILYNALHRGWGWTTSVTDQSGELLASAAFVYTHGRVSLLVSCSSPRGRELAAQELLIDYAVRQASGRPVLLDFMSGDHKRWSRFGASRERYWEVEKTSKLLGVFPV